MLHFRSTGIWFYGNNPKFVSIKYLVLYCYGMYSGNLRIRIIQLVKLTGLYPVLRLLKNVTATSKNFYGQTSEDSVISRYFEGENFTYVDIGAGEPILGSNTYFAYRKGMRGILVDPIRTNKFLAKMLRPRDFFLECLVGQKPGPQQFWEFDAYEYSTTDIDVVDRLDREGIIKVKHKRFVNMITLQYIVAMMPQPQMPWLLSVDVEGADLSVIKSFDFKIYRPRVICIEDHEYIKNHTSVQHDYISQLGYQLEHQTPISLIYADTKK